MDLQFVTCRGRELEPYLEALGKLRIEVFHEFPYLYEGDLGYEKEYLQTYLRSPKSFALLVFAQDPGDGPTSVASGTANPAPTELAGATTAKPTPTELAGSTTADPTSTELVGATTAIAMEDEDPRFQKPLLDKGYPPTEVVYFGESILRGSLRGQGLGKRFMSERLAFARSLPGRKWAAFCSVIRPSDHPRRPGGYRPLDEFWRKEGFEPLPGVIANYEWKDIGEPAETTKKLQFWIRGL